MLMRLKVMKKFILSALTSAVLFGASAFAMEEESNPGVNVAPKSISPDLLQRAKEFADKNQYEQAFSIYEDIVKNDHPEGDVSTAYNNLADLYFYGKGTQPNPEKAMGFYEESAKRGNKNGEYNWALHCFNGVYVPQNPILALNYFDKAARQGDPELSRKAAAFLRIYTQKPLNEMSMHE